MTAFKTSEQVARLEHVAEQLFDALLTADQLLYTEVEREGIAAKVGAALCAYRSLTQLAPAHPAPHHASTR
jgi:hypothetical protein